MSPTREALPDDLLAPALIAEPQPAFRALR